MQWVGSQWLHLRLSGSLLCPGCFVKGQLLLLRSLDGSMMVGDVHRLGWTRATRDLAYLLLVQVDVAERIIFIVKIRNIFVLFIFSRSLSWTCDLCDRATRCRSGRHPSGKAAILWALAEIGRGTLRG